MNYENLENTLKAKMGYSEEKKVCQHCLHVGGDKSPLATGFETMCHLNPACVFTVSPDGHCEFWETQAQPITESPKS